MIIAVFVTVPQKNAEHLARLLLKEKLCACVNIVKNVRSFFLWQGKTDAAHEALLIIKTKKSLFPALRNFVKNNHSYDVPEIIAFNVTAVNKEYRDWVRASCRKDSAGK